MTEFELYLKLGFQHIIDIRGYDHMLFLLALSASYTVKELRSVIILITSFTIGHSVSLALSTLHYILIPAKIIEFLIPVTIFITALQNFFPRTERQAKLHYGFSLLFGLVHGMGFSNYLKVLLGAETSIIQPLFAFNIGLEIGQLLIMSIYFIFLYIYTRFVHQKHVYWKMTLSAFAGIIAIFLMIQTRFW